MRHAIKRHPDIITAGEAITALYEEFKHRGYQMGKRFPGGFTYYLDDGTMITVYWEKGVIYEEADGQA